MTVNILILGMSVMVVNPVIGLGAAEKPSLHIHRLHESLFANYSVFVRPAVDHDKPTKTNVVFTIKQLESVEIKTQVMTSLGYFSINWTDEFLSWEPENYGGIQYITVPENRIWKPDYVINNDIGGKKRMGDGSSLAVVNANGQILWEPGYVATTVCEMDITYFPFDKQACTVYLNSWMTSNISLHTASIEGVSLNAYKENGEFEMLGALAKHTLYPMTYKENEMLEGIVFVLLLKRRTTFYWMSLVSPLIAFPFLSPLSFLVPPESGEKTTLAITALLSVFVFMGTVYDSMPKLSNTVSYFVLLASAQVFISLLTVVCNVIILCTYQLSSTRVIPSWLKTLVIRCSNKGQFAQRIHCNDKPMTNDDEPEDFVDGVTWRKVARCLDKVFFIVSFISVFVVTIIFAALMSTGHDYPHASFSTP